MRVAVTTEARFMRTQDGAVWTQTGPAYHFWTRYLSAFDSIRVVARVLDVSVPGDGASRVDGAEVEIWPLPYYIGPRQYLLRRAAIGRAVGAAANDIDAVVLRVPSAIGSLLAASRERLGLPYALEVVGDPYDVFAPGAVRHPVRPLLRHWYTARLRKQCRSAAAVAYVTEASLQARYPASQDAVTATYSSVELPATAYVSRPRSVERGEAAMALVSVGSLEQMYKGIDTIIEAVCRLSAAAVPVRLVHIGDGRFRPSLERLAERLGVADRVTFAGWLPSVEVLRRELDTADLFVMPSRTEGLPRALIEAMARGLPALGSAVGGIPELLPSEDLVLPDDPAGLAVAIGQFLADPARMASASACNLARARDFSAESLTPRRDVFYRTVREATEQRLSARSGV